MLYDGLSWLAIGLFFSLEIVTHHKSLELSFDELPTSSHLTNVTKITVIDIPKAIIEGLNTLIKNDLKFIFFWKESKNENIQFHHSFCPDCFIHRTSTANGDTTINIHRYSTLIIASTHSTIISIEYTIVVHDWSNISITVFFIVLSCLLLTQLVSCAFNSPIHIKYSGHSSDSLVGNILSISSPVVGYSIIFLLPIVSKNFQAFSFCVSPFPKFVNRPTPERVRV